MFLGAATISLLVSALIFGNNTNSSIFIEILTFGLKIVQKNNMTYVEWLDFRSKYQLNGILFKEKLSDLNG
jgi:hypothetical protein